MQGVYWCNDPLNCTVRDTTKIANFITQDPQHPFPDPTPWLPLVVQMWDGSQQFTVLNLTKGAISATNDSYPGDEVYYLGITYLPNQAGVISKWAYYPWTALGTGGQFKPEYKHGAVKHLFDQRLSDGWLGLKDDLVENVLAWNNSTAAGSQLNTDLVGGQARKPYMFGAGEQFGSVDQVPKTKATPFPPAGADIRHIVQLEHANSFYLWRVPNTQGNQMANNRMYKATLYVTDGDGNYVRIASARWDFQKDWGFADDAQPVVWTANKGDGNGAWVQSLEVNPDIVGKKNLPATWDFTTTADGLGILTYPGGNLTIKCVQATWTGSVNWGNVVPWHDPNDQTKTKPRQNAAGQNMVRFQLTGNAGSSDTKFVIALEEITPGKGGPKPKK
jgi:hypothetical protein